MDLLHVRLTEDESKLLFACSAVKHDDDPFLRVYKQPLACILDICSSRRRSTCALAGRRGYCPSGGLQVWRYWAQIPTFGLQRHVYPTQMRTLRSENNPPLGLFSICSICLFQALWEDMCSMARSQERQLCNLFYNSCQIVICSVSL